MQTTSPLVDCGRPPTGVMLGAIAQDVDLTRHMQDAVQSLRVCIAARCRKLILD